MSDYNSRRISEAELTVLEVLWDLNAALPAKTIQDVLKRRRGWERTTVRSLLTRLSEKGTVNVVKGEVAMYQAAFTREEYAWDLVEVLVDRMFNGKAEDLVRSLLQHKSLTAGDLAKLG